MADGSQIPRDKAGARRAASNRVKRAKVRASWDTRRFKETPIATGEGGKTAPEGTTRTLFPKKVKVPDPGQDVLIDGKHASKIGGRVLVGRLRGARIYTLTLEERMTCPTSCTLWHACYGNGMPWSTRWNGGADLERELMRQVPALIEKHETILVRLHVLGDFYSITYADLWAEMLHQHAGLNVFGYTAHKPDTEIGAYLAKIREAAPERFMIRHSGVTGKWGAFDLDFHPQSGRIGDAVVCPEQRHAVVAPDRQTHCGSCAVCWQTDLPIAFIRH